MTDRPDQADAELWRTIAYLEGSPEVSKYLGGRPKVEYRRHARLACERMLGVRARSDRLDHRPSEFAVEKYVWETMVRVPANGPAYPTAST